MRRLPVVFPTFAVAALLLAGCAGGPAETSSGADDRVGPSPATTAASARVEPDAAPGVAETPDAAAYAQADAWLGAVALPEDAVASDDDPASFSSFTGWPCGPIAERRAMWRVPGANVAETANWFIENPPADLVSTAVASVPDDSESSSTAVGFTPADRSQQGVVLTVERRDDGVAVRAEVAAFAAGAVCPTPPGGGTWGLPGQG